MNKLREKFKTDVSINTSGEAERFAKQCEQITDDFSVKFADFLHFNCFYTYKGNYKMYDTEGTFTTTELLQIFKTQYYGKE